MLAAGDGDDDDKRCRIVLGQFRNHFGKWFNLSLEPDLRQF